MNSFNIEATKYCTFYALRLHKYCKYYCVVEINLARVFKRLIKANVTIKFLLCVYVHDMVLIKVNPYFP